VLKNIIKMTILYHEMCQLFLTVIYALQI